MKILFRSGHHKKIYLTKLIKCDIIYEVSEIV